MALFLVYIICFIYYSDDFNRCIRQLGSYLHDYTENQKQTNSHVLPNFGFKSTTNLQSYITSNLNALFLSRPYF